MRQIFASADALALGTVELPHPALGRLTQYQWGVAVGGHAARHALQIGEAADAPGRCPRRRLTAAPPDRRADDR